MTQYALTKRQKDMLRSIAPSLEDGAIDTLWSVYYIYGTPYAQIDILNLPEMWKQANPSDFADLVAVGLFSTWGDTNYTLHAQKIIDAVNSNFGENEQLNPNNVPSSLTFTPIFGAPATTTQYKADIFVMMPFRPELKYIYDTCMKPAAQSLNMSINRGDDFFTKHTIMTDIWSAIYHCRLIIADCTGKNANVFYELGLAHTVGKPVITIAQNEADIPFDIQGFRRIIYSDTPDGLTKLADELQLKIPKLLDN